jgi:serine-type D-Ala-D-Ala carboxypeptidase/endopeptidase (penicillin-binding protein 4)
MLFARDETKRYLPASNMKLFTATWVLKQLGEKAMFTTRVLAADAKFAREGIWPKGAAPPSVLTLMGDGDPALNAADIRDLAKQVVKAQPGRSFVVRAQNAATGDELNGENNGNRYPEGWMLDDTLWYYGAPVTGLTVERNQIDITFTGTTAGELAKMESSFPLPFQVLNLVTTVPADDPRAGTITYDRGELNTPLGNTLRVSGFLAPGKKDSSGFAVPDPKEWARQLFEQALRAEGAQVLALEPNFITLDAKPVAVHNSPPIGTLLRRFLKSSDNLYGELLLRRAGATVPPTQTAPKDTGAVIGSNGMAGRGHRAMATWLAQSGVPLSGLNFSDGSGLSRYEIVTPISLVHLLRVAQTLPDGPTFYDCLPIAGVDGTLGGRMKGTSAAGNVHAKTGSLSISSTLSGYVTTRDGQRLAVSILTNEVQSTAISRKWQDDVMTTLANASWK